MNTTLPSSIFDELAALSEPRSKAEKRNASEVQEQIVVDAKGDTLSSTKYKRSRRQTEPDFIKLYLADVARLYGCQPRVLTALARRMEYQSNLVALTPRVRELVAKECGFKNVGSLKNALSKITAEGLIKKVGGSEYMIDPKIFGKGSWEKIERARRVYASITYTQGDDGKVRRELDAHFEFGEDRKADAETCDDFRSQCAIHKRIALDPGDIDI